MHARVLSIPDVKIVRDWLYHEAHPACGADNDVLVDVMPLMAHGGRPPSGDIEPPGGFEDALRAFKEAFLRWRAAMPADVWTENLEHKRAGAERWRR